MSVSNPYTVNELAPRMYAIDENMVRSFLIIGDERALLIDTGFCGGALAPLIKSLTALPVMLVNTHADGDHISCNGQFDKAYMHEKDIPRYAAAGGDATRTIGITDGFVFDLGGCTLETIWIPGHTPGSIALLDRARRLLFAGDTVALGHGIFMTGEGRVFPDFIASLKKLEKLGGAFDTIYSSHDKQPRTPALLPLLSEAAQLYTEGKLTGRDPGQNWPGTLYEWHEVMLLAD